MSEIVFEIIDAEGYGKSLILDGDEMRYYRIIKGVPLLSGTRRRIE